MIMDENETKIRNAARSREYYARKKAEGNPRKFPKTGVCSSCGSPVYVCWSSAPVDRQKCQPCRRANPSVKTPRPPLSCSDCSTQTDVTGRRIPLCPACRGVRAEAARAKSRVANKAWSERPENKITRSRQYRDKCRRRRALKLSRDSDRYTTEEIAERDGSRCGICKGPVDMSLSGRDEQGPTIDHITALANGGHDTLDNVQLAHRACNTAKGDR